MPINVPDSSKRPWGNFVTLSRIESPNGDTSVVKQITVKPKGRLSLQRHRLRSEAWTILSGRGIITRGKHTFAATPTGRFFIKQGQVHRIENTSSTEDLVFVEVTFGTFDEDDIERLEDDYERI